MPTAPSVDTPPNIHRLTSMEVEEVSLVDRAANKRTFLLVKRHATEKTAPMPTTEVTQRPDGTFTAGPASGPPSVAAPGSSSTPTTPKDADKALDDTPTSVEAGALVLTADMKVALATVLDGALQALTSAKSLVMAAAVAPTEADVRADALVEVLSSVSEALEDSLYAMVDMESLAAAEAGAASGPPSATEPSTPAVLAMSKRLAVRTAKRVIAKADASRVAASVLAKYGAKMAKTRKERFKQAMALLSEIMGELEPEVAAASKPSAKKTDAPTPTAKSLTPEQSAELARLRKGLEDAQGLVRLQAAQLRSMQAPQRSNATVVETTHVSKAGSAEISWPRDLNFTPAEDSFLGQKK